MPPAMHQPCTAANVGLEIEWSLAKVLPNRPIICTSATLSHVLLPGRGPNPALLRSAGA